MNRENILVVTVAIIVFFISIVFIFTTPAETTSMQAYYKQLRYFGLLTNPIVLILYCLSIIIMLGGLCLSISSLEGPTSSKTIYFLFAIMGGVSFVAGVILWSNWTYINSEFLTLISYLIYETYNPQSAPDENYYIWKYLLINPAKVVMSSLFFILMIPLFHSLYKIKRMK